jgi:peptide/nickel transport system ATP-binding protein
MEVTSSPAALTVRDLHVSFRVDGTVAPVVAGVSLEIAAGGTRTILGESGSGKSLTLRAILGILDPAATVSGDVFLFGKPALNLTGADRQRLLGETVGFVPQSPQSAFHPLRRIGPQLREMLHAHGVVKGRAARRIRSHELLASVGLADPRRAAESYPHELSGGMLQRAAIAMAIACGPKLLLADEPTTALDMTVQAGVLALFKSLGREHGMGLLLVTHDVGVATELGGEVTVMYGGRVVEEGPAASVLSAPRHPYLSMLLQAAPGMVARQTRLRTIPGRPPAPTEHFDGCRFAPRCPEAVVACSERVPQLVTVAPGRVAACPVWNEAA